MANKKDDNRRLKDLLEVTLVGVYLIQKLGKPLTKEIQQAAREKLKCLIHPRTLERALDGAKSRGFIAKLDVQVETGEVATCWKMKDMQWKQPPEYAHIKDLLPVLLHTDEANTIKDWFDAKESKGKTKKTRGNIVDDFHAFEFTAITLDPLLGSQINCQYSDAIKKEFPTSLDTEEVEVDGIWQRDELTGEFIIAPDIMQGWFISNAARYCGLPEARGLYLAFAPVRIRPRRIFPSNGKGEVYQYVLPVNSSKSGPSAPKPYEAIPAGQEITVRFLAPTKGCLSPEQYEALCIMASTRPRRGISPARGRRFGRFMLTSFKDYGPVKDGDLSWLRHDVPEEIMAEHGAYLKEAIERLKGVNLTSGFTGTATEGAPETPFPGGNGSS
jgi:hypothetical protein